MSAQQTVNTPQDMLPVLRTLSLPALRGSLQAWYHREITGAVGYDPDKPHRITVWRDKSLDNTADFFITTRCLIEALALAIQERENNDGGST